MGRIRRAVVGAEAIAAVALAALLVLVCGSVVLRWGFDRPVPDAFDFSRLLLGVAVFWGIAAACARDDHIRGDFLKDVLRPRVKRVVDAFAQLCVLVFTGLLVWKLGAKTLDVARTHQETAELGWSIWPFYATAWVATLVTLGGVLLQLVLGLKGRSAELAAEASADGEQGPGV